MLKPKRYCGDKETLPVGYDAFGSRFECLRKGYGAALYKKAETTPPVVQASPEDTDQFFEAPSELYFTPQAREADEQFFTPQAALPRSGPLVPFKKGEYFKSRPWYPQPPKITPPPPQPLTPGSGAVVPFVPSKRGEYFKSRPWYPQPKLSFNSGSFQVWGWLISIVVILSLILFIRFYYLKPTKEQYCNKCNNKHEDYLYDEEKEREEERRDYRRRVNLDRRRNVI